ncbi:beta-lactamase family protein [Cellulophaga sp. 20_2_10]|uniref:serine hydrolase domain-containing protein n=1 Tax=Cellulophaga sp. 20_2_10 TaxID=2942476 RepID=UPI00201A3EED|nr:serine hydrolase domain-containing protein [Cellulophaga sp. 20_2_10]MCL5247754.1 beta-lactamase family protein [Cellulophaga sp. 20_2_10]
MKIQNMYKSIKLFGIFIFIFSNCFSQQNNQWLDSISSDYISKNNIVGMSVSIVQPDSIYYGISGVLKQNRNQKIILQSKFFLASLTKSLTSLIAKKMEEEGLISFDTKFFDVFPELLKIKNAKKYEQITLSELLSHKARINDFYIYDKTIIDSVSTKTKKRLELAKLTLTKSRKSKNNYSNVGYIMGALMLEKRAGVDFEVLVKNTLDSLSLDYLVGYPNTNDVYDTNDTWGHNIFAKEKNRFNLREDNFFSDFQLPCWGLSMSILDYSLYIQLHLNGLLGKDNFLKSENYKELHNTFKKYNFGWITRKLGSFKISTHDGSGGIYFGRTVIVPDEKVAIVVLFNQTATSLKELNNFIEFIIKNYKQII